MTDSTPPSIPPRKRPTTPVTAGRPSASAHGVEPSTGRTVTSSPNGTPSGEPSGGASSNGTPAAVPVLPPTTGFDSQRTRDERPSSSAASVPGDEHDLPSPLMVAVDTATVWFKKAAGATSTAFAAVTRPRTEDPTMTTPASAPAAGAPPRTSARPAPTTGAVPRTTGAVPRTTTGRIPTVGGPHGGARRVRLAISRVDPWSVMKLSFLLSVAIGVMIVVAAAVVWLTLDGLHVFTKINDLVVQIVGTESPIDILQYVEFKRIVSGATLVAVIDVFLLTALSTIGAFLYNIVAALVGGVHVTMTDE
ncbi:hypothetical protein Cch01nite_14450 [Cellulomonas chitinilytica]|uniref:DUF3566 domain-containing protein n=1 Tax=Cellulomonas chitinilytica TaxID=398759 RepID=A0A919U0S6_9CELL|nr:DUF3566 domain-containing protein [Cellulomonas chitinilytica]GIG20721.1 hypothetical protein Cch01nite_14450 [Cellulomonas chitinilytica]